jgi:hypothetical protein
MCVGADAVLGCVARSAVQPVALLLLTLGSSALSMGRVTFSFASVVASGIGVSSVEWGWALSNMVE